MSIPTPAGTLDVVDPGNAVNKKKAWIRGFLDRVLEETIGVVGVAAGIAMAVKAMKTWADLSFTTSTIEKIHRVKSVQISDLRFIGNEHLQSISNKGSETERLVVVRGFVRPQQIDWFSSYPTVKSRAFGSSIEGVFLKTTTCKFLNGVGLRFKLPRQEISLKATPMAISSSASGWGSYVDIDLRSIHASKLSSSLPLETTYHMGFLNVINPFFYGLKEEKMLPVGKEITAIGYVSCQGLAFTPRLKPCNDLPFFVTHMTKDQMLEKLIRKKYVLLCSGVALGSLSIYVLSITFRRYWKKKRNCSSDTNTIKEDLNELRRRCEPYLNVLVSYADLVKTMIARSLN